jgi:hypothetical protein
MIEITNCVLIGLNAGINLTNETGVTIIGDNIRDLSRNQKNVLFLGDKIAIGTTIMGVKINLKEVIESLMVLPNTNTAIGMSHMTDNITGTTGVKIGK